jgi:hypothetical protein
VKPIEPFLKVLGSARASSGKAQEGKARRMVRRASQRRGFSGVQLSEQTDGNGKPAPRCAPLCGDDVPASDETKGSHYMRFKSTRALLVLVAVFATSAVAASSAWASGKPLVETKAASAIGKSEATLNGVVNPNGAETTYHFEYGTSASYGKSTAEVYVGSGATNVEELQKVAGLLAEQGYDFRIVAKNTNGTTNGANETFTTTGPKVPLAETVGASAVTETSATFNGVINPNGVATKYYFEYGTTISYGKKTTETSGGSGTANLNEIAVVLGLTGKTTYHYRIVAVNANGTADGADKTFYSKVGPEFKPFPAKRAFTSSGGISTWAYGGNTIECTKTSTTGELTGGQTVGNAIVVFTGCTSSGSGGSGCTVGSLNGKPGEIVTKPLVGELGTVPTSQATSGVGLLLKPESKNKWFTIVGNACTVEETFTGELAGEVAVIGKKQATNSLVFAAGTSGAKIKEITLDSGATEKPEFEAFAAPVSIGATDELKFEESLEIN